MIRTLNMETIDTAISSLYGKHYNSDFDTQIKAINDFRLLYADHESFNDYNIDLTSLTGHAFQEAGKFDKALAEFKKLYELDSIKAFHAQSIASILVRLDRHKEAACLIKDEIFLEKQPTYLLDLLFWYVINIKSEEEDLLEFKTRIYNVIDSLDLNVIPNDIPLSEIVKYLKAERVKGDRRYNNFMSSLYSQPAENMRISLTNFIKDEPVGYFRRMAESQLAGLNA